MVKNDALFSYVAPGNIFAWLLMPLRYCMPLRVFVQLNRTIIKFTHFPLLWCIYVYERFWLATSIYEPTDLIDNPGRGRSRTLSMADPANRTALFSPNVRVREESVVGYQKDHALEEVFRRGPGMITLRNQRRQERRKTQNAIRNWMDQHDEEGGSSHQGQEWPTLNSKPPRPDWHRRFSMNRDFKPTRSRQFSDIRSAASDPADLMSQGQGPLGSFIHRGELRRTREEAKDLTDADGDDELVTNDEEEEEDQATNIGDSLRINQIQEEDYFTTPMTSRFGPPPPSSSQESKRSNPSPRQGTARRTLHNRTLSTNTILYAPQDSRRERPASRSSASSGGRTPARSRPLSARASIVETPTAPGQRSPRRQLYMTSAKARPIMPQRDAVQTAPNRAGLVHLDPRQRPGAARRLSSIDLGAMSDNTNLMAPDDGAGAVPSSFQTQMAMALMKDARLGGMGRGNDAADRDRMSRLVLARMKTLEESFADVARELRGLKTNSNSTAPTTRRNSSGDDLNRFSALIEVAGRDRRKGAAADDGQGRPRIQRRHTAKRPVSRRSMKENKVGMIKPKSKGKEVAHSSDDDLDIDEAPEHGDGSYSRRGSSF